MNSKVRLLGVGTMIALVLTCILVGAPVSKLFGPSDDDPVESAGRDMGTTTAVPSDPDTDVIGWENGYWANESIAVEQSDGLTESEIKAFKSRTMARVEKLRGREFKRNVRIEFVTSEGFNQYVAQNVTQLPGNDQVWEALLIFGENTDHEQAVYNSLTASAAGMAAEEGIDHVVLPVENPDQPRMDATVLAHELAHMLQHQHYNLSQTKYHRQRLNDEMAKDGIVEGEAAYLDALYTEKCSQGNWSCVSGGPSVGGGSESDPAFSALMSFPYTDGEVYVRYLVTKYGWDKLDAMHATLPESTEPIIHRKAQTESLPPLSSTDRSRNGWHLATEQTTSIGEAGIFVLFWNQATNEDISAINPDTFYTETQSDPRNYSSGPSAGWGNDTLNTYRNGSKSGFVWVTAWDTKRDAKEFATAYRQVLRGHDATQRGTRVWVVPDGEFADAFYVNQSGTHVTIVNAPTVPDLQALHPAVQLNRSVGTDRVNDPVSSTSAGTGRWVQVSVLTLSFLLLVVYLAHRRRT
jgi:hypothetical protein